MRTCADSQRELDESEFYKNPHTKNFASYCRKCSVIRNRKTKRMLRIRRGLPIGEVGRPKKFDFELIADLIRAGFRPGNIVAEVGCYPSTVKYVRDKFVEMVE